MTAAAVARFAGAAAGATVFFGATGGGPFFSFKGEGTRALVFVVVVVDEDGERLFAAGTALVERATVALVGEVFLRGLVTAADVFEGENDDDGDGDDDAGRFEGSVSSRHVPSGEGRTMRPAADTERDGDVRVVLVVAEAVDGADDAVDAAATAGAVFAEVGLVGELRLALAAAAFTGDVRLAMLFSALLILFLPVLLDGFVGESTCFFGLVGGGGACLTLVVTAGRANEAGMVSARAIADAVTETAGAVTVIVVLVDDDDSADDVMGLVSTTSSSKPKNSSSSTIEVELVGNSNSGFGDVAEGATAVIDAGGAIVAFVVVIKGALLLVNVDVVAVAVGRADGAADATFPEGADADRAAGAATLIVVDLEFLALLLAVGLSATASFGSALTPEDPDDDADGLALLPSMVWTRRRPLRLFAAA